MTERSWPADLIDFLLPAGCVVCRDWIPDYMPQRILCDRCSTRLPRASWPRCPRCHFPRGTGRADAPECLACLAWPQELTAARYAFRLEGPAVGLVHALKYEGWREAAALMSAAMAVAVGDILHAESNRDPPGRTIVVPVPTTVRRERQRGYNQARLLADGVAESIGVPLRAALVRTRSDRSQTALTPEQRRENVRGTFALSEAGSALRGARAILIDDVLTTGATGCEAARVLAAGGAAPIVLLAFARALPGRGSKRSEVAA